jgi:hypothetical protein
MYSLPIEVILEPSRLANQWADGTATSQARSAFRTCFETRVFGQYGMSLGQIAQRYCVFLLVLLYPCGGARQVSDVRYFYCMVLWMEQAEEEISLRR